jgi:hypothetical protein
MSQLWLLKLGLKPDGVCSCNCGWLSKLACRRYMYIYALHNNDRVHDTLLGSVLAADG